MFIRIYITESQDFCLNFTNCFSSLKSLIFQISQLFIFPIFTQWNQEKKKKICDHLARKNAAVYEKDLAKVLSFINKYIPDNAIDIISDTSKFKKLPAVPTLLREGQLQCFRRKIKNKYFFTKEFYDKIYPYGSNPSSVYGLPKIYELNL